jgi:hypothetical protein
LNFGSSGGFGFEDFDMGDYTSAEDEELFGAIGRFVISWAHLELGLDCMVQASHVALGGKEIERNAPRALNRKLGYLRAVFKRLTVPEKAVQPHLELLDQIEAASETRHDIVHGATIEMVERSGEVTLLRLLRKGDDLTQHKRSLTTEDILKAANEVQRLGAGTLRWALEFAEMVRELYQQGGERKKS